MATSQSAGIYRTSSVLLRPSRRLGHRVAKRFTRFLRALRKTPVRRPVIICPYLHAHEAPEIAAKFGLDKPHGRKLDFFLWQDTGSLGTGACLPALLGAISRSRHCYPAFGYGADAR